MASTAGKSPAAVAGDVLVGARFAYGLTCVLAPKVLVRILMLRPDATPDHGQDYIVRLTGTRELFLAAVQAGLGGTSSSRAATLRLGMVVDAGDVAALWLAGCRGRAKRAAVIAYTAAGLASVVAAHLAAKDQDQLTLP